MPQVDTVEILNRLLATLYRSLPAYLAEASPWVRRGDEPGAVKLAAVIADQRRDSSRLAELIIERDGRLELGEFPMEFTDLNFLSLDFLLHELVRYQQRDIKVIEQCVAALGHDRQARELAEEILGSERAHFEQIEELLQHPAKS